MWMLLVIKVQTGRIPVTGIAIKIPAKTVVKIRPAKAFKDAIVPPKNGIVSRFADFFKTF